MKSNEVADESYSINGFKHFSDLAVAYFPQMASTSSASKKMRNCIKASNATLYCRSKYSVAEKQKHG